MNWKSYKENFKEACQNKGIPELQIQKWLGYANNLYQNNLPIIFDKKHLASLVGFRWELLKNITHSQAKYYRTFYIPKKNGGRRCLKEPYPSLKEIQNWLKEYILKKCDISRFAKAYAPKRNVYENVRFHKKHAVVIKFDVEDFFGSINKWQVTSLFKKMGYNENLAEILANLCCLDNHLPQGAPTSPYLSNIFAKQIDDRLSKYLLKRKLYYTRYSDDITISGNITNEQISQIMSFCNYLLSSYGLKLNQEKTKILRQHQKQYVTGVVVNDKISIDKKIKKKIRQHMFYIKKYGLESHMTHLQIKQQNYVYHLIGKIQWVLTIEKDNEEFKQYKEYMRELLNMQKTPK